MPLLVTALHGVPETDTFGNLSYWVSIEGEQGNVLVRHKGSRPPLVVGEDAVARGFDRVETVTSKAGKPYKKLVRPEQQPGNFGPRARDPKETAAIQRQHSQEMALRYAAIKADKQLLPEPFKLDDLRKVIDWFERDIQHGVQAEAAA